MQRREASPPLPEAHALTVSEFTARVRDALESAIPPGWVEGEVSNLRRQPSGHVYFSLKDEGAQLSVVLFRGDAARQQAELRDGLHVVIYGEVSVYEARGQYQLIARMVVDAGAGRLRQQFDELKRRLDAEGLFDPARKRPLPVLPRTLGFITSPSGAALQDFIRILQRRGWTGLLVVLPARVQGAEAPAELAAMLGLAQRLRRGGAGEAVLAEEAGAPGECFFDLLVMGRGGGSIEDLWCFNDEALVRAVAASRIPLISAVGHEIDFTLCDFAADIRAETPSAAAELISSEYLGLCERMGRATGDLPAAAQAGIRDMRQRAEALGGQLRLLSPQARIERGWQRLDDLGTRIVGAAARRAGEAGLRLAEARAGLERHHPGAQAGLLRERLRGLGLRLAAASPSSILARGYAIVRDGDGKPMRSAAAARPGMRIEAEFADGRVRAKVEGGRMKGGRMKDEG